MQDVDRTYTDRRRAIASILDPHLAVISMVPTNVRSTLNPEIFENSLWCSWADPETLTTRTLSVSIHRGDDGDAAAARVREMAATEAQLSAEPDPDAEAYEIPGPNPGEYVFVLKYLGDVTAIAGNCVVQIMPGPSTLPLGELAEPALEIARTVGCSPYVDDFQPPDIGSSKVTGGWTTADGLVYDPHTPPQP